MNCKHIFLILYIVTITVTPSYGLECYVCNDQEDNEGKCVTTISTCQPEEDVCLTEIKWGSRPYWVQGAQKQYYISKRCANNQKCKRQRETYMQYCSHIWYEDWRCSECCKGDRCNYYIISATAVRLYSACPTSLLPSEVLFFRLKRGKQKNNR